NAGFVPFTPQTMYIERGFGYGASQSATTGNVIVPMQSAGQVPTSTSVASAIASFTPYLQPETNKTSTTEIKASAGQSGLGGLMAGALSYYQTQNPASSNGCTPTRYVVLITDGLPTLDLNGKAWPPPGTVSATGYGMTVAFNSDGSLNTSGTNDQALIDTVNKLQALNAAGIKAYIVGLGAGVDPTQNPTASKVLTAMAIAGGTGNANTAANTYNNSLPYGYFPASSPDALVSDLQAIIAQIIGATQSVATSAVNSTGLNTLTTVYRAQFSTQDTYQDWTGNISAYGVNSTTGVVSTTASWSAQSQLDAANPSSRIIATWQPAINSGIPFEWLGSNSSSSATTGITPTSALGVALTTSTLTPSSSDTDGQRRLNYLRGDTSYEQRNNAANGKFRNRSHLLGDIVDSSPLYVGAPGGYGTGSYRTFASTYANRTPVLYVGANDGMLHAFNANNGSELFAFIPNGVFSNLPMLTSPFYNAQHHFFVDGSPQAGDVQFSDGTWHTVLAGGENAGGNTIYALDVTDPGSIVDEATLASKVLWEFTEADMGFSYSQPAFASTAGGYVVIFGNGYNSTFGKDVLYVVNPQTGAQMAKIDLCAQVSGACSGSTTNGLSSITVVNRSGNLSGLADTVYAGDLQGNLWRIDISDSSPANWQNHVSVLLQAKDSSGAAQPITSAPAVTLNPQFPQRLGTLVIFGTGQLLAVSDLSTTQTQTIYAVYDPGTATAGSLASVNIRGGDMVGQTLTLDTSVTPNALEATSNSVDLSTKKGWYDDLTVESRMRSVTQARIEQGGGVVMTTYTPNSNQCTGGGDAFLLVLNYATGGAFPQPEFIWPGSGGLNAVNGQNPVGLALGNVYAAAPTVITAAGPSGANGLKLVTESSNTVLSVFDRGGNLRRTSWWELQ
ncbi:MAG TPA: PilC/PilY family type IV pilus protein, partial [Nevskia sp.]|nr:PilC/PilY family type IV pilus protein [Nevskia sp.]